MVLKVTRVYAYETLSVSEKNQKKNHKPDRNSWNAHVPNDVMKIKFCIISDYK